MDTQPSPQNLDAGQIQQQNPEPSRKTNKKPIVIVIIILALLGAGAGAYWHFFYNQQEPIACTQEAFQCPDGSYVGRTGPNCEFAECPGNNAFNQCGDGICQDVTCLAIGCPLAETPQSCPEDCD